MVVIVFESGWIVHKWARGGEPWEGKKGLEERPAGSRTPQWTQEAGDAGDCAAEDAEASAYWRVTVAGDCSGKRCTGPPSGRAVVRERGFGIEGPRRLARITPVSTLPPGIVFSRDYFLLLPKGTIGTRGLGCFCCDCLCNLRRGTARASLLFWFSWFRK